MADAGCARRRLVRAAIREIPDWPKPGIMFQVRGQRPGPPPSSPSPAPPSPGTLPQALALSGPSASLGWAATDLARSGDVWGWVGQDITTVLLDPVAFKACIDLLAERYAGKGITKVAGFDARGLIFGAPLALALGCGFVPLRKPKKLPGETIGEEYTLEYGTDRIEMHVGHVGEQDKVLLVDDLIATGGTMGAGVRLMKRVGATIVECAVIIELPGLGGRKKKEFEGIPVHTLLEIDVL